MAQLIPVRKNRAVVAYAIVDDEDYERFARVRWQLNWRGYAERSTTIKGRNLTIKMHREVLGLSLGDGLESDHLNGNRIDNRRSNLEAVTKAENLRRAAKKKTHCPKGHPYDEANTYHRPDRPDNRDCRACRRVASKASRHRKLAA